MKKFLIILLLLIIASVLAFWLLKAPIMSFYLSKKLKTEVSVGGVDISRSQMKIRKLKIHNPNGFKQNTAFTCKEISISYSLQKLKEKPSVIDKIDLFDSYLYVECKNPLCTTNNWTQIMSNLAEKESKMKDSEEILISKLSMNNLKVDISGLGIPTGGPKSMNIDHLEFDNISSKEGFPTGQLIVVIFKQLGIFDYIKNVLDPQKIFDGYFKSLNPFSENKEENKNSIEESVNTL